MWWVSKHSGPPIPIICPHWPFQIPVNRLPVNGPIELLLSQGAEPRPLHNEPGVHRQAYLHHLNVAEMGVPYGMQK